MFSFIGSVLKYSALILVILVLSHVVQIRGVTVSQHVEHGLNWITGINPKPPSLGRMSASIDNAFRDHVKSAHEAADIDMPSEDQKQLNHLIQKSEHKK